MNPLGQIEIVVDGVTGVGVADLDYAHKPEDRSFILIRAKQFLETGQRRAQ